MSTQTYSHLAAAAVRLVEKVPAVVWAAWILGVVVAAGTLAFRVPGSV